MFDPDHVDLDDVDADVDAAAEELDDDEEFDPFADPVDAWDRAYDAKVDRELGID